MSIRTLAVILIVAALALAGCSKVEATPTPVANAGSGRPGFGGAGAMDEMNALALGTLALEETANAVTAEEAVALLPLWKMLQGGALQGTAETQAVLNQVRGEMKAEQIAAIEAMELGFDDLQTWMEEQGIEIPQRPDRGAQGRTGGGSGALGNLSEAERAQMRQELQNMTPEERATRMAERGFEAPEGGMPSGGAFGNPAIDRLVELLAERAAQ